MNKKSVIKVELPSSSLLKKPGIYYDYEDSFQTVLDSDANLNSTDIAKAFCSFALRGPFWIKILMKIRNSIVSLFGLKKSMNNVNNIDLKNENFDIGGKMFGFNIFDKKDNEIIFGKDDKHLNFRSSFLINNIEIRNLKLLTLSTVVKYNNWLGRLYFVPVKPFHKIIMKTILKRITIIN